MLLVFGLRWTSFKSEYLGCPAPRVLSWYLEVLQGMFTHLQFSHTV